MKHFLKQLAKSALAEVVPASLMVVGGARAWPRVGDGSVALTFDDGPHPMWTPRLLDMLHEHWLRATFFVIGEQAERHPELVKRIVAEGHTLGNHSYTHGESMIHDDAAFLAEVRYTRELLEDMTGQPCPFVRPPKGVVTLRRMRALWADESCIVLWNVDPKDFSITAADDVVAWSSKYTPAHGDVLLWHDNHPWAVIALNYLFSERANHPLRAMRTLTLADVCEHNAPAVVSPCCETL